MAESMKGLHRTHRCTEVSNQNIGETVTVMGWVPVSYTHLDVYKRQVYGAYGCR